MLKLDAFNQLVYGSDGWNDGDQQVDNGHQEMGDESAKLLSHVKPTSRLAETSFAAVNGL